MRSPAAVVAAGATPAAGAGAVAADAELAIPAVAPAARMAARLPPATVAASARVNFDAIIASPFGVLRDGPRRPVASECLARAGPARGPLPRPEPQLGERCEKVLATKRAGWESTYCG